MRKEDVSSRLGVNGDEFYITAPAPCPYLKGQKERKVFSYLNGPAAPAINSVLSQRGFRRSQNIIYLPACDSCAACSPVRVVAPGFSLTKSRRRVLNANADVVRRIRPPEATSDQFSILRGYLDDRHADGGMADMTVLDYVSMVEETAVDTMLVEYWRQDENCEETLIACALTDRLADGLSMVYSFFDPDFSPRSLGSYMVMDHVALALELGLSYVYLGYWVEGSPKMDYKKRFGPLEKFGPAGWSSFKPA